jgi:hypothetical protein
METTPETLGDRLLNPVARPETAASGFQGDDRLGAFSSRSRSEGQPTER